MGIRPTVKTLCPTWGRGRVDNGVNVSRPAALPCVGQGKDGEGESIVRPIFLLQTVEKQGVARGILKMMPLPMRRRKASGKTDEAVFPPKRGRAHEEAGASPRMSGPSTEERQYGTGV